MRISTTILLTIAMMFLSVAMTAADSKAYEPISLHPDNPRYLLWRGKPTVLVTSGEHYGAVMNTHFDYVTYLDELQSVGLNLTRIFSGVYCEAEGDFDIENNPLAPDPGDLICPFARSDKPGYANGGNKFDLTKLNDGYFARLKDFVTEAGRQGIVVEYTFFCPYYFPSQWELSPFNSDNNVNHLDLGGDVTRAFDPFGREVLAHPDLLRLQEAFVHRVVAELRDADNLYYEICNEAYGVDVEWQRTIAEIILDAEMEFTHQHLIAQNIQSVFTPVHLAVKIFNYHPGAVNTSVRENHGLGRLSALDETSPTGKPRGTDQTTFDYRRWAWTHMLDGGAIYNNLDYSFSVEDPRGSKSWGQDGKMDKVRKQLRILKDFMEGFDFVCMKPDASDVSWSASADAVHVLAEKGEAYAMYIYGGTKARLMLDLPAGRYQAEWVNTLNGNLDKAEDIIHEGGALTLVGPDYKDDIAVRIQRIRK